MYVEVEKIKDCIEDFNKFIEYKFKTVIYTDDCFNYKWVACVKPVWFSDKVFIKGYTEQEFMSLTQNPEETLTLFRDIEIDINKMKLFVKNKARQEIDKLTKRLEKLQNTYIEKYNENYEYEEKINAALIF